MIARSFAELTMQHPDADQIDPQQRYKQDNNCTPQNE
jgi:hypothetical protein